MDWRHLLTALLFVVIGYWLHAKFPGLLGKATGGVIAA